jgi:malonyl CoA-acyl carrier protein transacylase
MGANELYLGQSDMAIVGGVETFNDIFMFMCFSKTPALSPSGDCRPFAKSADGTMLGEGIAMLALRRLADAERDGDRIYAVVRGIGSSSDGRNKSVYAPVAEGQAKALRRAYEAARYSPATVELVEAHGTGTKAGDAAEFEGLRQVFDGTGRTDRQWCALGSVKSQIGHTKATAGAAGLFKIVMALHHRVLPPTIKIDEPHPALSIGTTPFYLNTRARPWIRGGEHPRRASVSSFGFGGSNFHVTAEEYTGAGARPARVAAWPAELLLLSAAEPQGLLTALRSVGEQVRGEGALAAVARASLERFDATLPARLALVASDASELEQKARTVSEALRLRPEQALHTPNGVDYGFGAAAGKLAFLFPGQGSQYLEMGADLARTFDAARAVWDLAANASWEPALQDVVFPRPVFSDDEREAQERRLQQTSWAQPAIGVTSAALLALLRRLGLRPNACAGHSFGEVTALHAAGVLDFDSFLRVARRRGELMAEAAREPGAMLAVAGPAESLQGAVAELDGPVVVANQNSPRQLALSGPEAAIEHAAARLRERGLIVTRLPVATAFHSPLVAGSSVPFAAFLDEVTFAAANVPVFSNSEAAPYADGAVAARSCLARQIARPVRFAEMVEALYASGVRRFVEVGPGSVLARLVSECLEDRPHLSLSFDRKGQHGVAGLWQGLGRLAASGVALDFAGLFAEFGRPADPRAQKKAAHSLEISGANYAKPYPPKGGAASLPAPNPPRPEPVAVAEPVAVPAAPAAPADAVALAFQEVQRQTAEAHEAYMRTLAESHAAFLESAQASIATLAALAGQDVVRVAPRAATPIPAPQPALERVAPQLPQAPRLPPQAPLLAPPEPAPPRAPAPALPLRTLLLAVVAEKTGYPADMLSLEMQLESDLGIDSIKRVEILATMQERVPSLPQVKAADMATLRTLGQVVAFLERDAPAAAPPVEPPAAAAPSSGNGSSRGNGDMKAALLAVVAEKTGYPADMLSLEMELEGDLGIDSIKRVEILAALQERFPGLPEVKATEMAALRTLGQIVARMHHAPDSDPEPAAPAPDAALERLVVVEKDAPALGATLAGLFSSGPVYVTEDGSGLDAALCVKLRAAGLDARAEREPPADARAVVCLEALRAFATPDEALAANERVFRIARALAAKLAEQGGVFVALQDTGAPDAAWAAGLSGLIKTAAIEWPMAGVRAIDIERGGRDNDALAAAIASELLGGGPELEVALRADGRRLTLATAREGAAEAGATLDERSVIVATGGGRGVTAACLIELARQRRPRIALVGRTALLEDPPALRELEDEAELQRALWDAERAAGRNPAPAELRALAQQVRARREIRATLAELWNAGSKAFYVQADVTDAASLREALAQVRRELGAVTAIVHGAGVIADKRIAEKTDEQFRRVFGTKVLGLRALLEATSEDPLQLLCMFSSVAGRFGNEGQADYAMANEVLAKVATAEARRRGRGCRARVLHWGPWDGGMVGPGLRAHFASKGIGLIPLQDGARQFVHELMAAPTAPAEVVLGASTQPRAERHAALEFHVSSGSHSFLEGHRIAGVPVLPVAIVLEWLARCAQACRADLALLELHDVKVQRGIRLTRFETGGETFRASCREIANGSGARLALELKAADGTLHYSALAEMAEALPRAPQSAPAPPAGPAPWPMERLYGELLFHGESFHVIRSLHGVDEKGAAALLAGVSEMGWRMTSWSLDAAALDGALQLAILVGQRALGQASLPTGIGRLRVYAHGPAPAGVHCRVAATDVTPLRARFDAWLTDAQGRLLAELHDLEMHALPAQPETGAPERPQPALS